VGAQSALLEQKVRHSVLSRQVRLSGHVVLAASLAQALDGPPEQCHSESWL
jgi:hypothetical protein